MIMRWNKAHKDRNGVMKNGGKLKIAQPNKESLKSTVGISNEKVVT